MATQAAYAAEKAIGHSGDAITAQDVTNPAGGAGDDSETMKALVWRSKNKVEIGKYNPRRSHPAVH
jgi:hypothetical protein